ncbi:hypothetical protein KFK09_015062 [Dendrobium nobile]|uniref:NADH dehydrogenase subunit 6 n=1 Tax=Dendrobium nobile TaxID=94219 RepID=A0A8T3B545_DENNO|nr:hypothetical protein KFK09_015062 [Dendrobium nobile]
MMSWFKMSCIICCVGGLVYLCCCLGCWVGNGNDFSGILSCWIYLCCCLGCCLAGSETEMNFVEYCLAYLEYCLAYLEYCLAYLVAVLVVVLLGRFAGESELASLVMPWDAMLVVVLVFLE